MGDGLFSWMAMGLVRTAPIEVRGKDSTFPQRLKPQLKGSPYGAAKAVPLSKNKSDPVGRIEWL